MSIGNSAFYKCSGLTSIISEIIKPFEISGNVFPNYSNSTLTVPIGTRSAYQSTAGWNMFTNIVEASEDNTSTKRTIHVATAGTLPNLISDSEKYTIEELTLTGELNGTDFRLLRDMAGNNYLGQNTSGKLKVLDLTNAKVVAGGEKYLDTNNIRGNDINASGSFHYNISQANFIPEYVFCGCYLTTIYIPNSVTSIGNSAFSYCSGLTSITIPNSVTNIGHEAFYYCSSLASIKVESDNIKYDSRNNCNAIIESFSNSLITGCKNTLIPNSVTSIGNGAFFGCTGLTSITIPNSVTNIDNGAFNRCSGLTSITIPNSVTSIGDWTFLYCSGLTSIMIPNSVTSIGNGAFFGCTGLTSIKVESGNSRYDSRYNCNAIIETSTNTLITGCKNTMIPNTVTSIGNNAFYNCSGLTSITIPSSVTNIDNYAFFSCTGLKDIISEIKIPFEINENVFTVYSTATLTVPNGTKSTYQSTAGWNKFTNIVEASGYNTSTKRTIHVATAGTLPNLISESEKYTIEELTLTGELNGTDFRLLRDLAGNNYLGQNTSGKLKVLDLTNAKVVAGGEKYVDTDHLPEMSGSFHYSIKKADELPEYLLCGCKFLSISLPITIKKIGYSALSRCVNLTSITIPNSVTRIESRAFESCYNLPSIIIPNSVTYISGTIFEDCYALASLYVENGNSIYDSRNNCNAIIRTSDNVLITGCKNTVIPSSVTVIGDDAFMGCSGLTSISIPNSVTSIGNDAFAYCRGLRSISIPNSVTNIGNYAFSDCSGLTSISIPNSVTSIGDRAFIGCSRLTSIIVESGNKRYDSRNSCNAIIETYSGTLIAGCENTFIPNSVTRIGDSAFLGRSGLTSISIPNSVTSIGNFAFCDCSGLTSISIPNSVTSIGNSAFSYCSGLKDIILEIKTPFEINENVFSVYSTAILTVPNGTKSAYQSTAGWNKFTNIVEDEADNTFGKVADVVDLGLSVKWASWNIGASKIGDYGGLYGAGDPTGQKTSTYTSDYYFKNGESICGTEYDLAHVKWGESWRLPTWSELEELKTRCTWSDGVIDGVKGSWVKGPNGNSIFMPWAGNRKGVSTFSGKGSYGYYWSGDMGVSLHSYGYKDLDIGSGGVNQTDGAENYWGQSIRPVYGDSNNGNNTSTKRTIHVATAGTLPNLISESEKYTIEELTLTGELNGTDFRLIRDMAGCNYLGESTSGKLTVLDLTNAKIVAGGEKYLDTGSIRGYISSDAFRNNAIEENDILPEYVFYSCDLSTIIIPNSVKRIGWSAFGRCGKMTSICIPYSVSTISNCAFEHCSGLTSITIPNSVKSIASNAFMGCSDLISITVESGNTVYDSREDCNAIISTTDNILILGCKNTIIPNSVRIIGFCAFWGCSGLTSVTIPNSVTSIDNVAFHGCSGLSSITIPNSVTSIGSNAFAWCSGLSSITIPNSVTSIGNGAFRECSGLTSVISEIANPFEITEDVFPASIYSNAKLIVPLGTKEQYLSTNYWNKFEKVEENNSVWKDLTSNFDKSVAFTKIRVKNQAIGSGVYCCVFFSTKQNDNANEDTYYNINFKRLTIGDGVKEDDANGYIFINSCQPVGDNWYEYEFKQHIYFSHYQSNAPTDQLKVFVVGSAPVDPKRTIHVATAGTLPNLIPEEEKYTIEELTLTGELNGTDFRLLRDMAGNNYLGQNTSGKLKVLDLTNAKVVAGGEKYIDTDSIIGNGIYAMGSYHYDISQNNEMPQAVFFGCYLRDIHVPNTVTSIKERAFGYCRDLSSITIPNSVTSIGYYAFGGCSGLTSISIPNSVTNIGNYAFRSCSGLTSIVVESGNKKYDSRNSCNAIIETSSNTLIAGCKNTVIPTSVTSIDNSAFYNCSGLTSISIPSSVTSIGNSAFYNCSGLTSISIPNSVTSIGNSAFENCSGLKDIISEIQTPFEINENVFSDYSTATLTVPNGTKSAYQSTAGWNKFTNIVESISNNQEIAEPIDLGLSVKWASWNIGASKPEEYGSYFSWGETTPKSNYAWSTYKFGNPPSKYNSTDNKKTLDSSDDAAVVLWGGKWRMPTNAEEKELYEKCKWTYTKRNGINGYQVTGPNGNSIFLPAAGLYDGDDELTSSNYIGWYWSSSSYNNQYALGLYLTSSSVYYTNMGHDKCDGHVIRPVYGESGQSQNIVITAKSYSREYGDANPTFEYTVSGGSISGTPKITSSATQTSSVGTYAIKIEKGSVTNSNVTFVDGTLTISKAPLTITAKSYTRKQGEANPTFDVTYSGFKNGETSSVLTKKPTCYTTATTNSPVGTYDITVSGAEAQNYSFKYVKGTLTVTEKNQENFTLQGISYLGITSTLKAEVQAVGDYLANVEIPSSVTYNGKTYQVTTIANNALRNRTFNYVSIPSTVTSINSYTFSQTMLGALIWNASNSLSSSVFNNMAMSTKSNFLLYVNSSSYAPSNVSNVVVGNTASSITLADGTNTRFYCPKAFIAEKITYTHHYGMTTGGNGKGWETIALPFDVQKIEHKTKGVLTPFALYTDMMTQRPFWLYELGNSGFRKTDVIKANKPYIISMPNDSKYDVEYIMAGDVTFSATNAQVYKTESLVKSSSNGKTFVPVFSSLNKASTVYALNVDNYLTSYSGSYEAGSRFISNLRNVYPFEAYMTTSSSSARSLTIDFEDDATGIDEIPMAERSGRRVKVYSLSGLLLIDSELGKWETLWQQLPSGVYIVNGKKTIK
jgi:hypothetical protein